MTFGRRIQGRFFAKRTRPALYGGSILDDFLFGRPFNTTLRVVRMIGIRRPVQPHGASVVIVNWNSMELTATVLKAVRSLSPADTEIIVIDNGSSDGSRNWLQSRPFGAKTLRLPFNVMHGRALDIGFAMATRPIVVTLDSDAFPFRADWLDPLMEALASADISAVGMRGKRDRLHPACAAYRRTCFFRTATSFTNHADVADGQERVFGVNVWDTGELLYQRLGAESVVLLQTVRSPFGGVVVADSVYHHEAMTTSAAGQHVTYADKRERWDDAVEFFLGSRYMLGAPTPTNDDSPPNGPTPKTPPDNYVGARDRA